MHVSSDIVMTVILPDGHSAVEEEALVVRYDCVLLIVFRTLQFQRISFVYNSNCPSDVRPHLLYHSLLCLDSILVRSLCGPHSLGVQSGHSGMVSKRTRGKLSHIK